MQRMFLPEKIKVGYQNRSDTYTKKLAYVIYFDEKGVLRKEKSWESWRDKKISPDEFENIPTSGFVLNKGVGGVKQSWGWNTRNEYVRVYDPRNFEFEISVENLLFILQECSSIKGKGLEGEFVYAWDGTNLVLLPASSNEYNSCIDFTKRKSMSIKKKDLKPGYTYITKNGTNIMYLGKLKFNELSIYSGYDLNPIGEKNVFANLDFKECKNRYENKNEFERFFSLDSLKTIAEISSESESDSYASILDEFHNSKNNGDIEITFEKYIPNLELNENINYGSFRVYEKIKDEYYSVSITIMRHGRQPFTDIKNISYEYDRCINPGGIDNYQRERYKISKEDLIKKDFYKKTGKTTAGVILNGY